MVISRNDRGIRVDSKALPNYPIYPSIHGEITLARQANPHIAIVTIWRTTSKPPFRGNNHNPRHRTK